MAGVTIPNIDDDLKPRLMGRAVKHRHAMEVEAPEILEAGLVGKQPSAGPDKLNEAILGIVEPLRRRRGRPINGFGARNAAIVRARSMWLAMPDIRDVAETGAQTTGSWQL